MSEDKAAQALRTGLEVALELLAMKGAALGHDSDRIQTYKDAVMELREAIAEIDSKPATEQAEPTFPEHLQLRCSEWSVYWRAPDAHGVVLSSAQAVELLQDALGVEVEIKQATQPARVPLTEEQIDQAFTDAKSDLCATAGDVRAFRVVIARAIERAHGIGEAGNA